MKERVQSAAAPTPVGPYSQAIVSGGLVFCAGQVGLDPASGRLVEGGVAAEAERALANLAAVLEAAGSDLAHVVKTTCFLVDLADFAAFNEAYQHAMPEPYPARSTFAVAGLPAGARVEIEAIAERR